MAGFHIHIAIAKRYIEKNAGKPSAIKNLSAFYDGTIAPDLVKNKSTTHYGDNSEIYGEDVYARASNYVNLSKYLEVHPTETDFDRGVFLHLITDRLFFTEYFSAEYLKSKKHTFLIADLYHSYDKTNAYVEKTYDLKSVEKFIDFDNIDKLIIDSRNRKIKTTNYLPQKILHEQEIDNFIEKVSNVDLEKISELFHKPLS